MENSSSGSLVPLALAILAIVLGGAGLYFGLTASQRLNPLSESMEAGTSSAARLEKDIAALDTQIAELSAQTSELKQSLDRMRLYSNQSEQAVKQLASGMQENRNEIVKVAGRVNELIAGGARSAATSVSSSSSRTEVPANTESSVGSASSGESSGGTYSIQSGDTFVKIAGKLGVSLQSLLDANPDADPRRLAIGQVINVPSN